MIKKIIKILLVVFFMSIIFLFSSDTGEESSKKSDGIIIHTVEILLGRKLNEQEKTYYVDKYVVLIRKMAHFTIYFLLSISFISLLSEYYPITYKMVFYTLLFIFLYACSDEIHQLFSEGRTFKLFDIFIDCIGGFLGSNLYYLFRRRRV